MFFLYIVLYVVSVAKDTQKLMVSHKKLKYNIEKCTDSWIFTFWMLSLFLDSFHFFFAHFWVAECYEIGFGCLAYENLVLEPCS